MYVGDVVMFVDEGRYAKWFYGKIGIVERSTPDRKSCRVRWIEPVLYHENYTTVSDFGWDKFEGYQKEDR